MRKLPSYQYWSLFECNTWKALGPHLPTYISQGLSATRYLVYQPDIHWSNIPGVEDHLVRPRWHQTCSWIHHPRYETCDDRLDNPDLSKGGYRLLPEIQVMVEFRSAVLDPRLYCATVSIAPFRITPRKRKFNSFHRYKYSSRGKIRLRKNGMWIDYLLTWDI